MDREVELLEAELRALEAKDEDCNQAYRDAVEATRRVRAKFNKAILAQVVPTIEGLTQQDWFDFVGELSDAGKEAIDKIGARSFLSIVCRDPYMVWPSKIREATKDEIRDALRRKYGLWIGALRTR